MLTVTCVLTISLFLMRLLNYMTGRITNANKIIQSKNQIQIFLNIIQYFSNLFKNLILLHLPYLRINMYVLFY